MKGISQRKVRFCETTPISSHMIPVPHAAVLSETIDKYKQVFLNAKAQSHCLEQSLAKFFGPALSVPMETERK